MNMHLYRKFQTAGLIAATLLLSFSSHAQKLTSFVNPMIGAGGHGHVFVGANVPFGEVQLGPDNIFKGWDWCSGYHYSDSLIIGFGHLHLSGTGVGDLGDVLIMPYTGAIKVSKGTQKDPASGYGSKFQHKNETVKPGFYSVKLDNGVDVELTASARVGYHHYH
ncbi:MAG: glycoside hydrolase family 92 protein, partial [Bacteroidota bacterium]|nr:glycoside hydrolase family 92 protein [Bacteroidota bacterium]